MSGWIKVNSKTYGEARENNGHSTGLSKTLANFFMLKESGVNFSMLKESGEIGAIALKASFLIEVELNRSMKQTKIVNLFQ